MSETPIARLETAIHKIFLEWANVEDALAMYFGRLLLTDEFRARIIMGSITSFQSKLKIIGLLIDTYVDDPEHQTVSDALKKVRDASTIRNKIAHTRCWIDGDDPNLVSFFNTISRNKEVGAIFLDEETLSLEEMEEFPSELRELSAFFGVRGNPKPYTSDEVLCLHSLTKWHRSQPN